MRDFIASALTVVIAVVVIYLAGYFRGSHDEKIKFEKSINGQAIKNAQVIVDLQTKNSQALQKIEGERDALLHKISQLQHPRCTDFGADFGVLYNESITGQTSPVLKGTIPFSTGTIVINRNNLMYRELLQEYIMCYEWAQSLSPVNDPWR